MATASWPSLGKVFPGDNARLAAASPGRFQLPAHLGPRGWVALRLDAGEIDWDEVSQLVVHSYKQIARLAASLELT